MFGWVCVCEKDDQKLTEPNVEEKENEKKERNQLGYFAYKFSIMLSFAYF